MKIHAAFWTKKFSIYAVILTSCGSKYVQKKSEDNDTIVRQSPEIKIDAQKMQKVINGSFKFKDSIDDAGCQGFFVESRLFISAAHCFKDISPMKEYALKIENTLAKSKVIDIIPKPSNEVEDLAIVEIEKGIVSDKIFNLQSIAFPQAIYPPFNMEVSTEKTFCTAREYHVTGLIGYNCPTTGAMSGALLLSPEGAPFAIHLGRKSALGYGLVLGSIKDALSQKIKKYHSLSAETSP